MAVKVDGDANHWLVLCQGGRDEKDENEDRETLSHREGSGRINRDCAADHFRRTSLLYVRGVLRVCRRRSKICERRGGSVDYPVSLALTRQLTRPVRRLDGAAGSASSARTSYNESGITSAPVRGGVRRPARITIPRPVPAAHSLEEKVSPC